MAMHRQMFFTALLIVSTAHFLAGMSVAAHAAKKPWEKQGMSHEEFWSLLETLYGAESPAVCLVDDVVTRMDLRGGRIGKLDTRHVRIAILDAKGAQEYAEVKVPYVKGWDKIKELSAYTIASDGTEIRVKLDQMFDVDLFPEYVLYSDLRGKKFAFPAFTDHCIVDFRYTLHSESPFVWATHFFQGGIPRRLSRCRIEIPTRMLDPMFRGVGWEQTYSARNLNVKPKKENLKTIDGDLTVYSWELEDVAAIQAERYSPPAADVCPSISFAPGTGFGGGELTWGSFGNWFCRWIEERMEPGAAIKESVQLLTDGLTTDTERVEAIFDYMRDEIRYVAVELDEGFWMPSGVELTNRVKYGDCKDQSALLVAMLREAGIDAEPALVRTRDRGTLNTAIVSAMGFNHCIVHITDEGPGLWIDPTAKHHGLGQLPWQVQGVEALLLRPYDSELARTPHTSYQDNTMRRMAGVELVEGSEPSCSGTIMLTGERAARLRSQITEAGAGRSRKVLKEFLREQCPGVVEEDVSIDGVDNPDSPLVVRFACATRALTGRVGEYTLVSPTLFAPPHQLSVFEEPDRIHPICLHFPERIIDEVMLTVPDDMAVLEVPDRLSLEAEYGYFERECSAQGAQVSYKSQFVFPGRYIPHESCAEMKDFSEEVRRALRDAVSLRGEPAASPPREG